jgi:uncharacterized OsmC-like protein
MTDIPITGGGTIHLPGRAVFVEYRRLEDGTENVRVEINRHLDTAHCDVSDDEIRDALRIAANCLGVKYP